MFLKALHTGTVLLIFLCDFFRYINDTANPSHADDNTPYVSWSKTNLVVEIHELFFNKLFKWFQNKCHYLMSTTVTQNKNAAKKTKMKITINKINILKLLRVTLEDQESSQVIRLTYVKRLLGNWIPFAQISLHINLRQRRVIMKPCFNLHFRYCS